jgi:Glutathione S-transferase, C-terminal domain
MHAALENGPWLLGDRYTLADIIVAPLIDRIADLGMEHIWTDNYPRVSEWYERMKARPAFQQTFYPGARMSDYLPLSSAFKGETQWQWQGSDAEDCMCRDNVSGNDRSANCGVSGTTRTAPQYLRDSNEADYTLRSRISRSIGVVRLAALAGGGPTMTRFLLAGLTAVIGMAGHSAMAADLGGDAPREVSVHSPPLFPTWSGLYLGAGVGARWNRGRMDNDCFGRGHK